MAYVQNKFGKSVRQDRREAAIRRHARETAHTFAAQRRAAHKLEWEARCACQAEFYLAKVQEAEARAEFYSAKFQEAEARAAQEAATAAEAQIAKEKANAMAAAAVEAAEAKAAGAEARTAAAEAKAAGAEARAAAAETKASEAKAAATANATAVLGPSVRRWKFAQKSKCAACTAATTMVCVQRKFGKSVGQNRGEGTLRRHAHETTHKQREANSNRQAEFYRETYIKHFEAYRRAFRKWVHHSQAPA